MEQVQETKVIKDSDNLAEWRSMLSTFAQIIDKTPPVDAVKNSLLELKQTAITSGILTGPQVSAICARCDNYINGVYGRDKAKEEYLSKKQ